MIVTFVVGLCLCVCVVSCVDLSHVVLVSVLLLFVPAGCIRFGTDRQLI